MDSQKKKKNAGNRLPLILIASLAAVTLLAFAVRFLVFPGTPKAPEAESVLSDEGSEEMSTDEELSEESIEEAEVLPPPDYSGLFLISELMAHNGSTLIDPLGTFTDWVEIYNYSSEEASLDGWLLMKEDGSVYLLSGTAAPASYTLFFPAADPENGKVSFSEGDTLKLLDPLGEVRDEVVLPCGLTDGTSNLAFVRNEDDTFSASRMPTPGYPSTDEGYEAFCASKKAVGPLVINEACIYNPGNIYAEGERPDWVEIRNISSSPVDLSSYYLSDSKKDLTFYQLPEVTLESGEYYLVICDQELENTEQSGFGFSAGMEDLFLSSSEGVIDYVSLFNVPPTGSMGRVEGEDGFFYFETPTPREENARGYRQISENVMVSVAPGQYADLSTVTVELIGNGTIYYTLNGSVPTTDSNVYTEPLVLERTTVIRCFNQEENKIRGSICNYGYFLGETTELPILSLVINSYENFSNCFSEGIKGVEYTSHLTMYEGNETIFSAACGTSLAGWTSLSLPKKSMNINFRSRYGQSEIHADIFGGGVTDFSNLNIRCGQDYTFATVRTELCQDLALELPDSHVMAQRSRYCLLFINGRYYGLYALKENISRETFANNMDVSKHDVLSSHAPAAAIPENPYYTEVLQFVYNNDITEPENYEYLCSILDIDSLIDWIIMEGWCANTDTFANLRYYRATTGEDTRWKLAFYDLDWSFYYTRSQFINVFFTDYGNAGTQMPGFLKRLAKNPDFRDALLTRYAQVIQTTLSTENVNAKMDELIGIVDPEIERDHERWWASSRFGWESEVKFLRNCLSDEYLEHSVDNLRYSLNLTDEDMKPYFPQYYQ